MRDLDFSDFTDAFMFWLAAVVGSLIGAIFASYADCWPVPLTVSMILAATVFYMLSVALLIAGGLSAIVGFRGLRK